VPDRRSRYTRYNVISSLNDHVETNGGKRKKEMGECRKDESVTDAQDKIATLDMRVGARSKRKFTIY